MPSVGMQKTTAVNTRNLFVKARRGNVVMNWTGTPALEVDLIAEEYFEAAKALVSRCEKRGHNDLAAYPILSLYRHALELFLKSLLILGYRFSGLTCDIKTAEALKEHPLVPLLNGVGRLLTALGNSGRFRLSQLNKKTFRDAIQELDKIDRFGQAFRYTFQKNGAPTVEQNFTFSLYNVSEVLDPILEALSNACLDLREHYKNLAADA